ncbi:pyridoxal-dependent decarboxylase domain-containing protein 1 [Pseudonaja textilis]|uniref:pyridoxal-dependent decarboxylase domain-containing protein 1 n=1 Tax=Pseudonaja textilis TaxID=8673 RepID=UPI000EA90F5C|nr:pyridoxal-dependent decarboxylase domain-containing protein 1 [Pseudonaja textilis]
MMFPSLVTGAQISRDVGKSRKGSKSVIAFDLVLERYKGQNEETPEKDMEKINSGLLKKLNELESDLLFSLGPEFGAEKNCIYIGMVNEDLDVSELVETIAASGREIEENSRLLENMTEVVRKGIQDAQVQLQKANEERLLEEGLLRQIPVVGSVVNWFSPFRASPKGQTFNLTAGSLESTETTYISKAQGTGITPPPTPTSSRAKQKFPGQKLFKRAGRNSDGVSETSSVSQATDLDRGEFAASPLQPENGEPSSESTPPLPEETTGVSPGTKPQAPGNDHPLSEERESLR